MDIRCEQCGGELIEGVLTGMSAIFFYPKGEIKRFQPKRTQVVCFCCKDCGSIQKLQAMDVLALK